MLALLLASNLACSDADELVLRVKLNEGLSDQVKAEVIAELKKASDCYWDANVD